MKEVIERNIAEKQENVGKMNQLEKEIEWLKSSSKQSKKNKYEVYVQTLKDRITLSEDYKAALNCVIESKNKQIGELRKEKADLEMIMRSQANYIHKVPTFQTAQCTNKALAALQILYFFHFHILGAT